MKTIIAGGRDCTDYSILERALQECPFKITSVVSGCAKGADYLGEKYAFKEGLEVYVYRYYKT